MFRYYLIFMIVLQASAWVQSCKINVDFMRRLWKKLKYSTL